MSKVKPMDLVKLIASLLEDGTEITAIRRAFIKGGLSEAEVDYLIGYVGEVEGNRLINIVSEYLTDINRMVEKALKASPYTSENR